MFTPDIRCLWRGYGGRLLDRWYGDRVKDGDLIMQLRREASLSRSGSQRSFTEDEYDAILLAAGRHGLTIELVGGPDEVQSIESSTGSGVQV